MKSVISKAAGLRKNIARAEIFSAIARSYHSRENFHLTDRFKEEIAAKLQPVSEEFHEHRALKHILFPYLREQSKEGFTARQYLVYRDNFFRRTQVTVSSIIATVNAAIIYEDFHSAALAFKNLMDEMGNGEVKDMHLKLLFESHNIHGMRVFNLDPLSRIEDAAKSKVLVPEVEEYRRAKEEAFTKPYPYLAGNTWAHEIAADNMLDHFRECFFEPYLGNYTPEKATEIMRYFTAHKDESHENGNVEQQHEKMAREAVECICSDSLANIEQVREGGLTFLDHQEKLWDGVLREFENAKYIGKIFKPNPRVIDSVIGKVPNPSFKQTIATELQKDKAQNNHLDGRR